MARTESSTCPRADVNTGFREAAVGLLSQALAARNVYTLASFDFAATRLRNAVARPVLTTLRVDNVRNDVLLRSHNRFLLQLC